MGLGGRPKTSAKILTAMYSSPGMFVVRADSPYKTIRDLVGQPVAFGAKGSGLPILSRYMLDGLGLKQDEDFKSIYLDRAGDGPGHGEGRPRRGAVGRGHRLAGLHHHGAERRALHRAERRRDRAHPRQAFVPEAADGAGEQLSRPDRADQFHGLMELHPGAADLPDDVAYHLARTLHGVEKAFCEKLAQACETTAANTLAAAPDAALIHPGVMKYLKEIGVVK